MWTYRARCDHVVDGDTYDLTVDLGFQTYRTGVRVRLMGADTPELRHGTPHERSEGKRARLFAESWLNAGTGDWPLTVTTSRADSWGRWVAGIHRNGDTRSLTDALLAAELAAPWPTRWRHLYETTEGVTP